MGGLVRRILVVLLAFAALLAAGAAWLWAGAPTSNVGDVRFTNELRLPPLLEPDADGVFRLRLQEGTSELLPGMKTATWGVNGPYLGPTLRASRGEEVRIEVRNDLPETTTLHWHGMHLPAAADGGPHQVIEPGDTWSPHWTIDQPAATLWYHPHLMGGTAAHVYRGVAGMFILDDPEAAAAGLPGEYGVDDVPVIVQDKKFGDDGALDESSGMISPIGLLGDEILVNGTHVPYFEATTRLVRLRLLNASNARIYDIGRADGRDVWLVGIDGGLLEAPAAVERIMLSPGERAEILVGLEPGGRTVLRSFAPKLGANPFEERFAGGDDEFDLLELRAADRLRGPAEPPRRLVAPTGPDPADAVRTRRFELHGRSINGRKMDMARIDEVVERGDTEVWEVENASGTPHSFHVHDVRFRVLDVDGGPPPPALSGLKDTVYVPPGTTMRLLTAFEDYADPELPYMFHCHLLEHEDRGMMGQFVVVDR